MSGICRSAKRLLLVPCALLALLPIAAGSSSPPQAPCPPPDAPPPVDNREGTLPLFEEAPVHPMELDGDELWVVDIPAASVAVFDLADPLRPRLSAEIPVGLGPVTVRRRPGSGEVWVVCQSSNAVFIVDARLRRVVDTVRVAAEPSGLVFDPAGETAYVTLSASGRVARVEASTRRVLPPLEFASEAGGAMAKVPEPRALLLDGSDLYVLSYQSGNGTTADVMDRDQDGVTFEILNAWSEPGPPPPDRDVLRFDAHGKAPPGITALWRMGTLNFDLVRGTGGVLYVSNVDHQNAHFSKMGTGREAFAFHRVSWAKPSATREPQTKTVHVDLNAHRDPRLPSDLRCAMPNAMALSGDGSRLYVACYETRTTMVVDTRARRVVAALRSEAAGPRGLALNERAGVIYVYNRADNSVQVYRLPDDGGVASPVGPALPAGFDPTPAAVKAGRRHFIDAGNSASGLVSCNTCHADGQSDGLAWDLRDFTGDLPRAAEAREVDNVIKVTMDLRGIEATPPYHWRGDRDDLADFNTVHEVLFGGRRLSPEKVRELEAYVFSLALPPNPRQDERRALSPRALAGFGCFVSPAGRMAVTCRDCHTMEGGLATNNQIISEARFPVPSATTQLQGMFEKRRDTAFYAGAVRPVSGWGFGNHGSFASAFDFTGIFEELTTQQKELLDAFLDELDTGMAPATAYASSGPDERVKGYLIPQAEAGNIDLVARAWIGERPVGFLYDPHRRVFRADTERIGDLPYGRLAGATFLGVPVGSGWRLGIDRDLDFLPDGDEAAHGASTSAADTDGDGFPDGYEVRHGSRPGDPTSRPVDSAKPTIRGAEVVWVNSTVAKIRWETDEETVARVRVVDGWITEIVQPARQHSLIVRGLKPGRDYTVLVEAKDLAHPANRAEARLTILTQPPLFRSVHMAGTTVTRETDRVTGMEVLRAEFSVVDELDRPVEGAVVHFKVVEWAPGKGENTVRFFSAPPTRGGRTAMTVPVSLPFAEILVDRRSGKGVEDPHTHRLYFHPLDGEHRYWARPEPPTSGASSGKSASAARPAGSP
ncbi:MAG TPA: hypothetical protein VN493_01040 [Thermoanaerobaculia bacterium]|nr:hypothetical protein [Thermoanaerobaculia bacterium]